jgi:hypothetical protein
MPGTPDTKPYRGRGAAPVKPPKTPPVKPHRIYGQAAPNLKDIREVPIMNSDRKETAYLQDRNPASVISGPTQIVMRRQSEIFNRDVNSPTRQVYQQMID